MAAAKKTAVKPAETVAGAAVKDTASKTEEKKAASKAAEKKTTEKKTTEKETAVKKTAEKKSAAKKAAEIKSGICIQFSGKSYSQDELLKMAKDVWEYDLNQKADELVSVDLYVKPEENTVYYVMNGEFNGSFYI